LIIFSRAHWCPPCRNFTPKLAEIFKKVDNKIKDKLDIVFVSCDEDQADFDEYFKEMPWKALPFSGMLNLFFVQSILPYSHTKKNLFVILNLFTLFVKHFWI
jgi:thiol-disulfide isomerase/thioredoxin